MLQELRSIAIRPVLMAWWARSRLGWTFQLPADSHAHTRGVDPDRILLMGDGAAAGLGVLAQDLALAGQLARRVTALTGRAIDVDVAAERDMTPHRAQQLLLTAPLARYDVLVLVLGTGDALTLTPTKKWQRDLDRMCNTIETTAPASLRTFIVGIPDVGTLAGLPRFFSMMAGGHGPQLNMATRHVCARHSAITYVPFDPDRLADGRRGSKETYGHWAELIAPAVALGLKRMPGPRSFGPQDETMRQHALNELSVAGAESDPRFGAIVSSAQNLFGATAAAITFLDRDRVAFVSANGVSPIAISGDSSFCALTIERAGVNVVPDAAKDRRFADHPHVAGAPHLRFYAGYPIEAPDGTRIGALCIFDAAPRAFSGADASLLRSLAQQAQNLLWQAGWADPAPV